MRAIALALLLAAAPARAAPLDWVRYSNDAYGYRLDVPPGFVGRPQTDLPEGQTFGGATAEIMVWGEPLRARDFEAAARAELRKLVDDGWAVTFQVTTPRRAAFELRKGSVVLQGRMIPVCAGRGVAAFRMGYGREEGPALAPLVETMALGFKAEGECSAF